MWRYRVAMWAYKRWVLPHLVAYVWVGRGPVDPGMSMSPQDVERIYV